MNDAALLDPSAIEKLAIDCFANVRGPSGMLANKGDLGVDLQIVEGQAKPGDYGTFLTVRLLVSEGGSIRDIKEQEVVVVPADADDARLAAYLEGLARSVAMILERGAEIDTMMPHDFIPARAFADPDRTTAAQFAAYIAERAGKEDDSDADVGDLSGTEPVAANEALERAIAEQPERIENHLVYADWLTEHGDPRGELVTCRAPGASAVAQRRAAQIFVQNERYFAGNLTAEKYAPYIQIEWELGWLKGARLASDYDFSQDVPQFVEKALGALMKLPSSKFIQWLTLGCFDFEGDNDYGALYPALVEGGPRLTMRKLFIGDTTFEEQELSWTRAGDVARIRGLYPRLRDLKIRAGSMELTGALDYPLLESFVIESGGMSQESVRALAAASFPRLTTLEVWLGSRSYGATSTIDDVMPILAGANLPKVERLGLKNCEYTDEICREIVAAPVLDRVTELDLSMGLMTDAGVGFLLSRRERFARVRRLDVSKNYLTQAGIESLRELGSHVEIVAGEQKQAEGDWRYVSVGE